MAEVYVVADDVGWVATRHHDGVPQVTIAPLPDGPPVALHDASAAIWLAAVDLGRADDVVARVAAETGEEESTVAEGVRAFLDELVERGLLAPGGNPQRSSSSPSR